MRLSEEHIAILTKVKASLAEGPYEGTPTRAKNYICWNILCAVAGDSVMYAGKSLGSQIDAVGGAAAELIDAIEINLDGMGCMENFLSRLMKEADYRDINARDKADAYANMARACWVDRMLETGEIK